MCNWSLHTSGLLQWKCGAQGWEAHPWGNRAQGSWGDAALSPCPTAVSCLCVSSLGDALPQHPNTAHHQKAFLIPSLHHFCYKRSLLLDVLPIFAFSFHQHDTETCWTSGPVFTFLYSSVPFLLNHCPFLILCALIIPAQVSCLALVSNLIPPPPKPFLLFVELIWILILLSNIFAVPPSLVPSVNLISILSIPSSRLLMETLNRTDCLPRPQASVSLSVPFKVLQRIFPLQRGGGTSNTDFCGNCYMSQWGQWVSKVATQILNMLLSAPQILPEVCFIPF